MIGTTLGDRYQLTGELGRGGMGIVYRALDPVLDRDVAVKLIPPMLLSAETEERFQREARLVAKMDHPGIVPIYDFGRHDESHFLVMPVAEGASLRDLMAEESLRLGEVLDIGTQVAEALEYSHARGVVHRDIKPENIMVSREDGDTTRTRVMDFGLAVMATRSRITQTGVLVGTMGYLSPEQVLSKEVDGRADLYALGTVLYECLVGKPPFAGEAQSIFYRILHEHPTAPRELGVEIDEHLEGVILSCLAKEPAERPQKAADVAHALRLCSSGLRDSERNLALQASRSATDRRPVLSPFVGRKAELAVLQGRLNDAIGGQCQLAFVGGDPGTGKTRLLDELESLARARGFRVLHGRFVEQNRALPYQGFCEAIQEYFRQKESTSSTTELPDLSDVAADLVALFPMLAEIEEIRRAAGEGTLTPAVEAQRPENRTQVFELLARTLIRIGQGRPLVLLLEDLHGAEISIEALQYIVPRLGPTPTLIVGTYRSGDVDRHHPLTQLMDALEGDRRFASLNVGPFSLSEHRLFLETLLGDGKLADDLVQRVFDRTEGVPFFTKELVRSLLDSGTIDRDDSGRWSLTSRLGVEAEALPATIQQAVEKRIQRLPRELRDILSVAAVIGKTFDFRELEALAEGEVDDAVDRLVQEGLIEEYREARADILGFSSAVVRDVLYGQIGRRKRRSLHRRCGELLEKRQRGKPERVLPQLVYHFSEGDVPDKTVEYGLAHARQALGAFSPEEAMRAAGRALEFLDDEWDGDPALEGEARLVLARAHRMAGDIDGALLEAERAIEVFSREKQESRRVEALHLAADTAWRARRAEAASRWVGEGIEAAREAGETEHLRPLLSLGATLAGLRSDHERARALREEAERLAAAGGDDPAGEEIPRGGSLVVPLTNPLGAREPSEIDFDDEAEVYANVFETLLATDQEGSLIPALAEAWQMQEDGHTLRLTLRADVRFEDGEPVTADGVKRSFERTTRHVAQRLPTAFGAIEGIEAFLDGSAEAVEGLVVQGVHEIEMRLAEPLPVYPALLTDLRTAVVRETPEGLRGTGPFRIAEHGAEQVVLERNERYWKGDPTSLDTVVFRPGMSASSIRDGFDEGTLDIARGLLPEDLEGILRDPLFRGRIVEAPRKNTYFALFNVRSEAGSDASVRRALVDVVRTTDLVWQTLGRFAQPANGLIPPGILGHDPGRRRHALPAQEAGELLRAAGIPSPLRLRAAVHPLLQDRYEAVQTALFSLWSELGVEVSIETTTMPSFLEASDRAEGLDLVLTRWNADYDDPDNFTHTLFHSRTGMLRNWFSSPEADRLLEDARTESRPAVRQGLYREFEALLGEEGVLLPLFHDIDYRIVHPSVRRLRLRSSPPYVNYAEIGKARTPDAGTSTGRGQGGVIHVPIGGVVRTMDPAETYTEEQAEVVPSVFETLTRDVGGTQIAPWLAAEFHVEDGGNRYRFRLRDDVRFHDGRRLTARDVRHSYERLLSSADNEARRLLLPIRGAKAILEGEARDLSGFRIHSTHGFTIDLDEPVSFFPALLSYPATAIVPEGTGRLGDSWESGCAGTGPFRVVSFRPAERLELEASPGYWRKGYPRSGGLVFRFGASPEEVLADFRTGRFSLATELFPEDVESLRREPEFASGYRETPNLSVYFVAFNANAGPLQDRSLRRRLAEAIDVPTLIRQSLGRVAVPAVGIIPPGLLGHDPVAAPRGRPSGPMEIPSEEIELTAAIHPVFFGKYAALSKGLEDAFARVGVRIRRINETVEEYVDAVTGCETDIAVGRWQADYPDADTFAYGILHSRGGNFRQCGSPETDRLAERGRAETEPDARHRIYRQIEEIVAREALLLPLFHEQVYRFARPEVEGLSVSYWSPIVRYEDLRLNG